MQQDTDERRHELEQWVAQQCGESVEGVSASSDASFRRYFRFQLAGRSLIGMDAPPPQEDCRPFVTIAKLLAEAGVTVPEIIAEDVSRGYLLLSDLGRDTYLDVINQDNADDLFDDAIDALLKLQLASTPEVLPPYDEALLRRELELFPEWYLGRHLGQDVEGEWRELLDALFEELITQVSAQNRVYVHRDYMPRNLMFSSPNPGVLDFQDAVYGPISYDPICLFKDAFLSWPEQQVEVWLQCYWQRARDAQLPVPDSFQQFLCDCDYMGVQRHLKVIGIFARICHRDGKPRYLADVPRFFRYLDTVAARRPELSALRQLLERVYQVIGQLPAEPQS